MKLTFFLFIVLVSFSSCTVPTYVQSTPNIPLLEGQHDFEVSLIPPFANLSAPDLLYKGELQLNYAPLENIFIQGSFLLGSSVYTTNILNWNERKFGHRDFSFGAGYFANLEEHHFSFSAGYGAGQLNQARSWFLPQEVENIVASFGKYNRFYTQGAYTLKISDSMSIGLGLRYEVNKYKELRSLNASFNRIDNTRVNFELLEWSNRNLNVFTPVVSFTKKSYNFPLSTFVKIGASNMQNWNDIHVNKSYLVAGVTFSPELD